MSYLPDFPGNNDDAQGPPSSNAGAPWEEAQQEDCLPVFQSENMDKGLLNMVVDDRDDEWLKWDGTMEAISSIESRQRKIESSFYNNEASGTDIINNSEASFCDGISEDTASFGLSEPNPSYPFPFQPLSFMESNDNGPLESGNETMSNSGRPLYAYSTLSAKEEQRLRGIAMPDHIFTEADSLIPKREEDVSPVTELVKPRGRPRGLKRKSLTMEDQQKMFQNRKQSHNTVEKRYRLNLNDKIELLRCSIPKFNDASIASTFADGDGDFDEEQESSSAGRPGKAAVLTGAVEYISELEESTKRLAAETAGLKTRLAAFERLAIAGSIFTGDIGPENKPPPPA